MATVTVIDYGIGNLMSVTRAFEHYGAKVILTDSPEDIIGAERLVLPGVGAFAEGMAGLRSRSLIEPIRRFAAQQRPFIGICLGMQMMMGCSEEFGLHEGLGLIDGKVTAIPDTRLDGQHHKIPHIGWNELVRPDGQVWEGTILSGIAEWSACYFVHSFTCMPADERFRLADCYYGDRRISAVIRDGNIYGCQFHPEKSGTIGLEIISNFLALHSQI